MKHLEDDAPAAPDSKEADEVVELVGGELGVEPGHGRVPRHLDRDDSPDGGWLAAGRGPQPFGPGVPVQLLDAAVPAHPVHAERGVEGDLQLGSVVLVAGTEVVMDRLLDCGALRGREWNGCGENCRQPEGEERGHA
jgi:hypothetical protein